MAVYGDESVTISQLKSILSVSRSGTSQSIDEHNTDPTAHPDIRELIEEAIANGDMIPLTNEEIDAILASSGGGTGGSGSIDIDAHNKDASAHPDIRTSIEGVRTDIDAAQSVANDALEKAEAALNSGGSSTSSRTPFRIEIPKCTNPSSTTSLNDTPGTWVKLGHWEIASFYSSSDFMIGGIYDDDTIQITGVSTDYMDNDDECSEFIENYVFAIRRDDDLDTEYYAPEGGVASITLADPLNAGLGTFIGNAHYTYWMPSVDGKATITLKMWGIGAISMEDRSVFVYDGKKRYKILNLSLNFSVCKKDLLKTTINAQKKSAEKEVNAND